MKTMPKYDVTDIEQELIDQIPVAVKARDTRYIINLLTELYTNEEYGDCLSAMMIIEKYLFRAYELLYFAEGKGIVFDIEEYFFDEKIHNDVIDRAKKMLDSEKAAKDNKTGVILINMGMSDPQNSIFGACPATHLFMESALGGNIDGAYNYAECLSRGEGCDENKLEAAFWYWAAANQGHAIACESLAMCFEGGKGVCADEMSTVYWYLRSFISGNSEAILVASVLLKRGYGIPNQELLGAEMCSAAKDLHDMEKYKRLMDTAFDLCEYLEMYIYNR